MTTEASSITVEPQPDPLHEGTHPQASLGDAAVSGSLWTVVQLLVVKLASAGGTLALMHLLAPEEFGVATLAFSLQTMVVLLQPFTLGDVLLARPGDLARVSGTAHRLCLYTSAVLAIAVVAAGPWAAHHYKDAVLRAACVWVALRPFSEWTMMLPLARLRAQLRFKTISTVDAICLTGATISGVVMAWLHCGYVSVLLPQIVFASVRAWLYRRASPAPPSPPWIAREAPSLLHKFLLSGLGQYVHGGLIALIPLIVGSFTGQREVGWYTMAFTLSVQVNTLAGFSMGLVLQPIFARMSHDVARQSAAFLRACRVIATLAMPICLIQAMIAPIAFKLFLPEKWTGAIVLVQILSFGQAFYLCTNPAMGFLKAQGRFAAFMWWQAAQFVLVTAAMLVAGRLMHHAPLVPIVLIGGLYPAVSGPIGVWMCVRGRDSSVRNCLDIFLRPFTLAAVAVLPVGWLLMRLLPAGTVGGVATMVLLPIVSVGLFVLLVRRFDLSAAEDCRRLFQGVARRLKRRPATVAAQG